ncbi:MAG: PspC family transcriptional regulator [Saprospiraceae bacterium]|nr:MAG: PspC domain-containing protein [Bacteroidetes bacterium OLB9]MCO6463668.1 PspC family transcriptional regulator [Saprospiraceae bacterium]MCZ2336769.1 PspC family transcriptional regulator [Chitinophagales bacterium]
MSFVESKVKPFIEKYSFGVCSYIADKWGLDESKVRLYFIYSSFIAFGSPVIFYLVTAFWLNIKKVIRGGISLR